MTGLDLTGCEAGLAPLAPMAGAPAAALELARAYNESVEDFRAAVLEPARRLAERGGGNGETSECVRRTAAELAFWRRVLARVFAGAYVPDERSADGLVRYLLS